MINKEDTMTINEQGYADLHLHTNRSDGYCSPRELIDKVLAVGGLNTIAIVDHDEIGAIEEAMHYGGANGLEILPGVELSVNYRGMDVHVLGYCFDYNDARFVEYLGLFKEQRRKRAELTVQELTKLGMPISFESVLDKAGEGSIGRPHIANVLIDEGYVSSFQEAFNKFLGNGKPAHFDKFKIEVAEAFQLVKAAGGICSIAHPGLELSDMHLLDLIKSGADAIEVFHPKHNEEKTHQLRDLAESNGVLVTGGSDFHGGSKGEEALGKYRLPYENVAKMKGVVARFKSTDLT